MIRPTAGELKFLTGMAFVVYLRLAALIESFLRCTKGDPDATPTGEAGVSVRNTP
jgi:hypothetical protein